MEVITGTPGAEFGDKSSLIAEVTTRSGLGSGRVFGNVDGSYGYRDARFHLTAKYVLPVNEVDLIGIVDSCRMTESTFWGLYAM